MRLIHQSYEILTPLNDWNAGRIMEELERSTRLCYKSEDKIDTGTADKLVASIISRGHHAMLEHQSLRVRFITDRGVTHELVRHRIAAFAQESTRYCNYADGKFGGECTFIIPSWFGWDDGVPDILTIDQRAWHNAMLEAEGFYFQMLDADAKPQEARAVLPNSLKTEIDVTANIREWRHILTLRAAKAAHPQMQDLMRPLLAKLKDRLPILFGDIGEDQ